MPFYRNSFNGINVSPTRELYGKKQNRLIGPLDLCLYHINNGNEQLLPNTVAPGALIGAAIKNDTGAQIGTVENYAIPPVGNVVPLVITKPEDGIDFSNAPSATGPEITPSQNDTVLLDGTPVQGSITGLLASRPYIDNDRSAICYQAKFGQHLQPSLRGKRIIHQPTNGLLGMLFVTDNQADGSCDTLIYPTHLI